MCFRKKNIDLLPLCFSVFVFFDGAAATSLPTSFIHIKQQNEAGGAVATLKPKNSTRRDKKIVLKREKKEKRVVRLAKKMVVLCVAATLTFGVFWLVDDNFKHMKSLLKKLPFARRLDKNMSLKDESKITEENKVDDVQKLMDEVQRIKEDRKRIEDTMQKNENKVKNLKEEIEALKKNAENAEELKIKQNQLVELNKEIELQKNILDALKVNLKNKEKDLMKKESALKKRELSIAKKENEFRLREINPEIATLERRKNKSFFNFWTLKLTSEEEKKLGDLKSEKKNIEDELSKK